MGQSNPQADDPKVVANLEQQVTILTKVRDLLVGWIYTPQRLETALPVTIMSMYHHHHLCRYAAGILQLLFGFVDLVSGWIPTSEALTIFSLGLSVLGIHSSNVAAAGVK